MSTNRAPLIKIFTIGHEGAHALAMRELFVRDDLEIALRCDANMAQAARGSFVALMQAQKREAVRLSIVAIQRSPDEPFERVNDGAQFTEMDDWRQPTYTRALACFGELNGASEDEGFLKGARPVSQAELLSMIGRAPVGTEHQGPPATDGRAGT